MKNDLRLFVAMLIGIFILSACGDTEKEESGVSQERYDKVVDERDDLEEELKEKEETITDLEERIASLESQLEELNSRVEAKAIQDDNKIVDNGVAEPIVKPGSGDADESSIEIVAEYTLADGGWYTRHFFVIKNNSSEALTVKTNSLAYDADNNLVGAADAEFDVLGSGCTSAFYEAFQTDSIIDHYDTTIKASKPKYYKSVIEYLSYDLTETGNGAVIQVTNNGPIAAQFVEGKILFFNAGQLVGFDTTYFVDDDNEIKSGDTISKQFTSYNDFDSIEFYLDGRAR